jgi:hypothetical protein
MDKFVEVPKNDVKAKIENSWYQSCRERKVPFITVKSRTKLADVHWDYITYPPEVEKVLKDLGVQLRDAAIAIFNKYADNRSEYTASEYLVSYKNLEIPKAKLAAAELYDLIVGYVDSK